MKKVLLKLWTCYLFSCALVSSESRVQSLLYLYVNNKELNKRNVFISVKIQ